MLLGVTWRALRPCVTCLLRLAVMFIGNVMFMLTHTFKHSQFFVFHYHVCESFLTITIMAVYTEVHSPLFVKLMIYSAFITHIPFVHSHSFCENGNVSIKCQMKYTLLIKKMINKLGV